MRHGIIIEDDTILSGIYGEGEIIVNSAYLASGYWRKPEYTAARFRQASSGRRAYRTGDLGYKTEDGCLTHMGRQDFQVKIGGHNVDMAEVEHTLLMRVLQRCGP